MNKQLILFFLLNVIHLRAQNLNGYYQSSETSFQDDLSPESNFSCKAILNIFIKYNEGENEKNMIVISDPSTNKDFKYALKFKPSLFSNSKYYKSAYWFRDCYSEKSKSNVDIIIYYNFNNQMTLMISSGERSQALKKMVKIRT